MTARQTWGKRAVVVHDALLSWYATFGRDLPWRRTCDPYAILVSEIMLQQTQVDRVRNKYEEFLEAFPSFQSLATSPVADVIRRWAPLGYNRRAVRLHAIARTVLERSDGALPATAEELRSLDGLGAYSANAVACFAFGEQVPVVDTNVRRTLGRVFMDEFGTDSPRSRTLQEFAAKIVPIGRAYAWNQALMDLGATICTARSPRCAVCPVAHQCAWRAEATLVSGARKAAEKSASYHDGERFEETTRYFKGRIVDRLRALGDGESIELDELGRAVRVDYTTDHLDWLLGLVEALERDGLAARSLATDGLKVSLPWDAPFHCPSQAVVPKTDQPVSS